MYPAQTRRRLIRSASVCTAALAIAAAAAFPAVAAPSGGRGTDNSSGNGTVNSHANHHSNGHRKNDAPAPAPTSTRHNEKGGSLTSAPGQTRASAARAGKGSGHGQSSAVPPGKSTTPARRHGSAGRNGGQGGADAKSSGHNPPGNNGTVKIHAVANDLSHHNVPHVSCSFFVDFWGFDQSQVLDVSFTGQAPTGNGIPVTLQAPDGTEIVSPDPAGGGNDFDGELEFRATAGALAVLGSPQAQQGYHLKLTVTTHQPGDHKYKVFWVQPCTSASTPTSTSAEHPAATAPGTTGRTTSNSPDTVRVLAAHLSRTLPHSIKTAPTFQSLPFTGAAIGGMVVAGLAALGVGTLMTMAGRQRRRINALK